MLDIYTLPVTAFQQNCRLLLRQEDHSAVLVDPASARGARSLLQNFGDDVQLKAILLTHGHLDHVGGVAELMQEYPDVPVYGPHKDDRFLIQGLDHQARTFGLPSSAVFEPQWVYDGQVLDLFEDASFKVLHTPGHTPGGVCYYCAQENFVLTGDTLFAQSVGRTDFEGGSFSAIIDSIKEKLMSLPDETDVFCGHGEDTTIGIERTHNPYIQG